MQAPRSIPALAGLLILSLLVGSRADPPTCSDTQYLDGDTCKDCPDEWSTTEPGDIGLESCLCVDNYFRNLNGECEKCPVATVSTRGANQNISGCSCISRWAGKDGVCVYCGGGSYAMPPDNTDASDCQCADNWYGSGGFGTCQRCPYESGQFWSMSVRGANEDISSCTCPNNWYGENGDCKKCPYPSYSTAPNNKDRSSCVCANNWYMNFSNPANENVTECRRCRDDFPNTWSEFGSNFEPSDCKCNPSFYGTGGSDCTRCPVTYVTDAPGGMWLASVIGQNENSDWKVSCNQCGSGWAGIPEPTLDNGNPVINKLTNGADRVVGPSSVDYAGWPYYEITGCKKCAALDEALIRSWPGENSKMETACQCRALDYLDSDDDGKCKDCPGITRSITWENWDKWPYDPSQGGAAESGIESCLCDWVGSQSYYGPVDLQDGEGMTCGRCPTNSWRVVEEAESVVTAVTAVTNVTACKCRPGYYGRIQEHSDTCTKCPSGNGWSSYSKEFGSEELSDCECSNGYYGPFTTQPACIKCPDHSTSVRGTNSEANQCICNNNYYRDAEGKCQRCPHNGKSIAGMNEGVETCSCPDWYYGENAGAGCKRCDGNGHSFAFNNQDLSKCSCGYNRYGPNAAETCQQCPTGTRADAVFGRNIVEGSCSCLADHYGAGFGLDCTACPEGTKSLSGMNYAPESCSCPADFYGPGGSDCTPCPDNSTSEAGYNYGVYACQCPEGKAMSYNWFINQVKQPAQCVVSEYCDGVIDKISNKCWKLFERTSKTSWEEARTKCDEWAGAPTIPDAFIGNPDYIPTPGDLPSIVTNEDLVLSTIFFDDFGYLHGDEIWVGATDQESEGNWKWTDGSTYVWQDSLWGSNQPDNGGSNANQNCATIRKAWYELPVNTRKPLLDDYPCSHTHVFGALCTKSPNKCISGNNVCSLNAECVDRDFGTGYFGYTCECHDGYLDVHGNGTVCQQATVEACNATFAGSCHYLANCQVLNLQPDRRICSCPEGMTGDGIGPDGCKKNSWTVRSVLDIDVIIPATEIVGNDKLAAWPLCKESIARLFFDVDSERPMWFVDAMHHSVTEVEAAQEALPPKYKLVLNALFETKTQAEDGMDNFNYWAAKGVYACTGTGIAQVDRRLDAGILGNLRSILAVTPETVDDGTPGVYTWTVGTTSDPIKIAPTGMEVEAVYFKPECLATGCWVVDVLFTRGENNFVSFYLPHVLRMTDSQVLSSGDADLSVDYDYTVIPDQTYPNNKYFEWKKAPETTFSPKDFPCRTHDYNPSSGSPPPRKMTACCIPEFRDTYRPVMSFYEDTDGIEPYCAAVSSRPWDDSDPSANDGFPVFGPAGSEDGSGEYKNAAGNMVAYTPWPRDGLQGGIAGMPLSHVEPAGVVDPFIGQYKARFELDEVELRELAGKMRGTVGVEHTVDTFIGLAEFKPTGVKVFDPFATQVAIHLEKTDFFSVSTHGVNDYTFLEYINLRLVAVYDEDTDPTENVQENGERTSRTNSTGAAHYVQVTFTLGAQYIPIESGLIPLDSVRVGQGPFIAQAFHDKEHTTSGLFHACSQYDDDTFAGKQVFDARIPNPPNAVSQQCAPSAAMCVNPVSIPDQFVVFNIPLGIDWFPEPSSSLSENVFVDLVVSAIDDVASGTPNNADPPQQMKTTLTASIPVVRGGINIFCDQITAKTDLVDVVKAHLIIGSAQDSAELSRLTIFEDIASSDMRPVSASLIDTDSIEAGLMTLVLEGNASYFSLPGASLYGVQLEDVITLHFMEPADTKFNLVKALLATPGADNNDQNGLDTDGYTLNGAFRFVVDRVNFRAYLEPTAALLGICPFNPPRPTASVPFPSTCVQRRDIKRRTYPARNGGLSTAVEVPAQEVTDRHTNGVFMTTLLGDSDYSYQLGQNFSQTVADEYTLNGQWKRAYMINPGYEWTPTQTGGRSIFQISQKIVLFALINLDEVFNPTAPDPTYTLPNTRPAPARRMLLQKNVQNSNAGLSGAELTYQTSYKQIIASSYGIPDDRIATIQVAMRLDLAEACKPEAERHAALAATMLQHLTSVSSPLQNVLLLSHSVDMQGASCPPARRRSESIRRNGASPTVDMEVLVAFATGTTSQINLESLQSIHGVLSVSELDVSPKVSVDPDYVPDHDITPTGPPGGENNSENNADDSSDTTALVAGICGGVGGLVIIAAAVFLFRRNREKNAVPVVVQALDTRDLKAQLADEC